MNHMRDKVGVEKLLKPNGSGLKYANPRLRLAPLICYIRIPVTENQINKISEQLRVQTCALRLLNTLAQMK